MDSRDQWPSSDMERVQKLRSFTKAFGIPFHDENLLVQAFTHSSYVNEHRGALAHNERLEFLGDAVLELFVSHYLFEHFTDLDEGELTKFRAAVVCEPSLVKLAEKLKFADMVFLGKGEEATGGRQRPALLADIFEAFVGALYLDQGADAVRRFLDAVLFPEIRSGAFSHRMDYKSELQEYVQRRNMGEIDYTVVSEKGPAHNKEYVSRVLVNGAVLGTGTGRSKKESEQEAARQALNALKS